MRIVIIFLLLKDVTEVSYNQYMNCKPENIFAVVLMSFIACFFGGCTIYAPAGKPKVKTLLLWVDATRAELEYYHSRASCYEETHGDLSIKITGIPFSDMKPRLLGQGNGSELPDIVYISSDWIGELADRGIITALPKELWSSLSKSTPGKAVECMTYKDQRYLVPVAFDGVSLITNRDLIAQEPLTMNDLNAAASKEGSDRIWPLVYDNKNFYYHGPFYFACGGTLTSSDPLNGNAVFDSEPLIESLLYTLSLETTSKSIPVNANHSAMMSLFCNGRAVSIISGPWDYVKARKSGVNLTVTSLPELESGKRLRSFVSVHGLVLTSSGAKDSALIDFMQFLASEESQKLAMNRIGIVPVSQAIYEDADCPDWVKAFRNEVDKGVIMPNVPSMAHVWRQMNWILSRTFSESISDSAILKKTVEKAQAKVAGDSLYNGISVQKRGMP